MKILKTELKNSYKIRTEMDFPVTGIEFIDITPLFIDQESFKEIIEKFISYLKDKKIDYIVGPEARGFLLASAIAYELGVGCIPVRKQGKLPPTSVIKSFDYVKEYGKDTLELPKLVNEEEYNGKNFYIVDDIYATGNTLNAIKKAINDLGGNVVGEGVVLNIKELNHHKDLFSLMDVNEN